MVQCFLITRIIYHRLRKIFNIGELKQLRAKRADRALARGVHGGPGGWPPGGGCKGAAPPWLRKFCILQAKYAQLQALFGLNLQIHMIWGLQGDS